MDAPDTATIQGLTKLEALKSAAADEADPVVASARAEFKRFTGINWPDITDPDDAQNITRAVRGLAEWMWVQESPETLETLADFDLLQSFSAGNYSETRRSPEDARKARQLVGWPWLSDLLWGLMTDDKRAYWIEWFSDGNVPAFSVTEMDWGNTGFSTDYIWGA